MTLLFDLWTPISIRFSHHNKVACEASNQSSSTSSVFYTHTHTHTDGHVSIILLRNELRWDNKDIVVSNYYGGCEGAKKGKQILCLPESS